MDAKALRDIIHGFADFKRQQAEQRLQKSFGDPYQAERARREQLEAIQIDSLADEIAGWMDRAHG